MNAASRLAVGKAVDQGAFVLEKLVGPSDKDAAIAAGFTLNAACHKKINIWARVGVTQEFERLTGELAMTP